VARRARSKRKDGGAAQKPAGPRPFWSGTISFGLVSVPVDVHPATRSMGTALRMLAPDGTPLQRRYFDPQTGRDVEYDDLVRGYEVEEGKYVVVTDEELEAVAPRKSRDIDLQLFVDRDELDPIYFDRAYVLVPAGDSSKPYRLLADVMEREKKAGIATAVMRDKEYLLAITADDGLLRAQTLRFAEELRLPKEDGLPKHSDAPAAVQVKSFERAIAGLEKPSVAEKELVDRREERFRALVERKRKRGENVVEVPQAQAAPDERDELTPEDLFETIRRSLAKTNKRSSTKAASSAGAPSGARRRSRASRNGATRTAKKTVRASRA
jgi:DNA end-binding protein Ku